MALGGILATALTTHAARTAILTVGGVDVVLAPTGGGNVLSTAIETIRVDEAGPGGVSGMSFRVDDPASTFACRTGDVVLFQDCVNDRPLFFGFVHTIGSEPLPIGRSVAITADGVEITLDWAKVSATTFPPATDAATAIQALVANTLTGLAMPLRVGIDPVNPRGSAALPINLGGAFLNGTASLSIAAGATLRAAINSVLADAAWSAPGKQLLFTVDFTAGLRAWNSATDILTGPSDWFSLNVVDSGASTLAASNLQHVAEAGPHAVIVNGTGITATVTDGTGLAGETAVINDTAITAADQAYSAGLAYLTANGVGVRGEFDLVDATSAGWVHPGSAVQLTDAQLGIAAGLYRIMGIGRTFAAGGSVTAWHVTYGGLPPSLVTALRRLTRNTLS